MSGTNQVKESIMMKIVIGMICFGILVMLGGVDVNAAPKSKSKKPASKEAESMQCREMTLIGVIGFFEAEQKDANGKVVKVRHYLLTDSKKTEWKFSDSFIEKVKAFEGMKVKWIGMVIGNNPVSIKSIEKIGK